MSITLILMEEKLNNIQHKVCKKYLNTMPILHFQTVTSTYVKRYHFIILLVFTGDLKLNNTLITSLYIG